MGTSIEESTQALEEAVIAVADAAKEATSNATRKHDGWLVPHDSFDELREAISTWRLATEAALAAIALSAGDHAHGGDA